MLTLILTIKVLVEATLNKYFGLKSQKGVTIMEYALIAALISLAAILILPNVGTRISAIYQQILDALS